MRLSFSSIDTYENCPAKWRFQYVDGLEREPSPALAFGSSVHLALEWFHAQKVPVAPPLDELLRQLGEVWIPEGYADAEEESRYRAHAEAVLARYHADNADPFVLPAAIEQPFRIEIEGVPVTGKIDRLDRLPSGGYEVIDYKTNRKLPPQRKIDGDLQLSIYHLAAREIWGVDPERLTMYYVLPGQRMSTTRTPAQLDAVRRRVADVAERIEAKRFDPTPNPLCGWCSFQPICPAFRHRADRKAGRTDAEIAETIDEWVRLHHEREATDARIATLAARLLLFAKEHDYRRLFADDGYGAERRPARRTADPEVVRALLEPIGRYDDVLSVDPEKLAALADEGGLPPEVEAALLPDDPDGPEELVFRRMQPEPRAGGGDA
ncbi:MAG: RecB family exonuclease [Actinomycetota bacterium]